MLKMFGYVLLQLPVRELISKFVLESSYGQQNEKYTALSLCGYLTSEECKRTFPQQSQ